jgi:methylmalonyl-CoA mutase C-terminal domain/subunit
MSLEAAIRKNKKVLRVLLAKLGLDGHDRGVKVIARALSDAGMEVIYTGLRQVPQQIVSAAIQEDADAIAVSILSGAHMTLIPELIEGLKQNGAGDIPVIVGGIIPDEDAAELKKMGVSEVMGPGTPLNRLVETVRRIASMKR